MKVNAPDFESRLLEPGHLSETSSSFSTVLEMGPCFSLVLSRLTENKEPRCVQGNGRGIARVEVTGSNCQWKGRGLRMWLRRQRAWLACQSPAPHNPGQWRLPITLALWPWGQEDQGFKVILGYTVNSRPAWNI